MSKTFYAVFDTNVLVSALMSSRQDSPTVALLDYVIDGRGGWSESSVVLPVPGKGSPARLMRHKYLKMRPFKKIFFRIGA